MLLCWVRHPWRRRSSLESVSRLIGNTWCLSELHGFLRSCQRLIQCLVVDLPGNSKHLWELLSNKPDILWDFLCKLTLCGPPPIFWITLWSSFSPVLSYSSMDNKITNASPWIFGNCSSGFIHLNSRQNVAPSSKLQLSSQTEWNESNDHPQTIHFTLAEPNISSQMADPDSFQKHCFPALFIIGSNTFFVKSFSESTCESGRFLKSWQY